MSKEEKMPTWSRIVVGAEEFHTALKVITAFPNKKPDAYDVVQFRFDDNGMTLCAGNSQQAAKIKVSTYFKDVEGIDQVFEVTNASAKLMLKLKPDMGEETDAHFSITVKKNEVVVKDESGTCGDLTEVTAHRIAPALPIDVPRVIDAAVEELSGGVDAANRALLTSAQAGALSVAARWLDVDYIDPVGLARHTHMSRVYVEIKGVFEAYSFVPDTTEQPELPLDDDVDALPLAPRIVEAYQSRGIV